MSWELCKQIYTYDWYKAGTFVGRNYEYSPGHKTLMEPVMSVAGEGGRVLDVGCAGGQTVYAYHCAGLDAYGIDMALIANIAKENYPEIADRLSVVDLALDAIPFPDDYFALAHCGDVLEHIYDRELFGAVAEVVRVSENILCRMPMNTDSLAHDALVIETHDTTHEDRLKMIGLNDEPLRPCVGHSGTPLIHPNEHSRDFWIGLFELLGMREEPLEERFYHEPYYSSNLLSSWNSLLLRKH